MCDRQKLPLLQIIKINTEIKDIRLSNSNMNSRLMLTDDVRVSLHMIYQKDVALKLHYLLLRCMMGTWYVKPGKVGG